MPLWFLIKRRDEPRFIMMLCRVRLYFVPAAPACEFGGLEYGVPYKIGRHGVFGLVDQGSARHEIRRS